RRHDSRMPNPKINPAKPETIHASGRKRRPGETLTGCWLIKIVRGPKAKGENASSISHSPPRTIATVSNKKMRNNSIFRRNMYQYTGAYPSEPNHKAERKIDNPRDASRTNTAIAITSNQSQRRRRGRLDPTSIISPSDSKGFG